MVQSSRPLFTRLRRHRGLWVLAVFVLLIKLSASTLCLADAPEKQFAQTTTVSALSLTTGTIDIPLPAEDADSCVLGEVNGCHCACAHALTLPSTMLSVVAPFYATAKPSSPALGLVPDTTDSLLRPPLA